MRLVCERYGNTDQCLLNSLNSLVQEVNRVSEVVTSLADPSANVIFGAVIDDQYEGEWGGGLTSP